MSASQYVFSAAAFLTSLLLPVILWYFRRGLSTADKLLALDTFNTLVALIMLLISAADDSIVMLDVTLIYIVISLIITLCFARCVVGGAK